MSKTSRKFQSSRASASIPAVQAEQCPQPAVQNAATVMKAPEPSAILSQITSPAEQVPVETRPSTLPAVAVFLGAAFSAFLLALVLVALLGSARAGRSSRNVSSFCCSNEAFVVLSVINSSIEPCEDFYAYVCSRVDAGTANYLSSAFRSTTYRGLLQSSAVGSGRTASGRMLASLNNRFQNGGTHFGEDVADFVTAILSSGLADQQMNSSRMVRFFADLSLKYGLPAVISFSVGKAGTALTIERNDDCFSDDSYKSSATPGLHAVNEALNVSVTIDQLAHIEGNLMKPRRTSAPETVSQESHISPFASLSESHWAAIMNDVILPAYPNVTTVVFQKGDNLNDILSVLINIHSQPAAVAYAIVCTALTTRDRIDNSEPGQLMEISCHVLDICEIEERLVIDAIQNVHMENHIRSAFAETRTNVIERAKGHPMFHGTSQQELTDELNKVSLMLPKEIVVSDVPFPAVSKTFAANLLKARSYVYEVRKAKAARKVPSADSLFLPTLVRHGDVIYFPTNLYVLLNQSPDFNGALDIPTFRLDMAVQMWSFLLERRWSPKTRENIDARLKCFRKMYFNDSADEDSLKTATAALSVRSSVDDAVTPQWHIIETVNNTKMSVARLVYLMWVYNQCTSVPGTMSPVNVNTVLRNSPAFGHAFGCSKGSPMTEPNCCLESC
ncbi:hypothetical protein HPB49_017249 [Dermacentor silvarum]|uniref:Uncharacterized protein n=1 Tax=Dermacentor silvarum TaxID=543639 RepID=A0ACB8C4P1_DERSI|nr:hypothetical protein HPB49_017249 [Dermacentor silvarum]